jgi:hypothetical protein
MLEQLNRFNPNESPTQSKHAIGARKGGKKREKMS